MCSIAPIDPSGDAEAVRRSRTRPPARTPGVNGALVPIAALCTPPRPSSDSSSRCQKPSVRAASG